MNKENEPNKEPLINEESCQIEVKYNKQLSPLNDESKNDNHLYEIPDLSNVTQNIMCRLIVVSVVCIVFLIAEVIGGLWAQSLAILSDAAHMFSDMSGFFISIFSIWLSQRPASQKMSFGYHRAEVIGALASIVLIWGLTILLLYEATERMIKKILVTNPLIMLITAGFGLICNLVMAKVLHSSPNGEHNHHHHNCHNHHDHNHHKESKQEQKKKKYNVEQKRSMVSENGLSLLVIEQSIEHDSVENKNNKTIEEVSNGIKSICNGKLHYQQQQIIQESKQTEYQNNNYLEDCHQNHPNYIGSDDFEYQNNTVTINNIEHEHTNCCSHDHNHSSSHEHESQNEHHHNYDKDQLIKERKKQINNHNLSQINEHDNYNLKAAMIHVIGDILQSIGVLIAALLIYFFGQEKDENHNIIFTYWQYADPFCTYLFSILVLFTTFGVAKECLRVLMEGTPKNLMIEEFRDKLNAINKVKEIHDLHIWSLAVGKPSMSAHIVCIDSPEYVLRKATKLCRQFGIYHSTIQIELFDRQGANDYIRCNHNLHK